MNIPLFAVFIDF